MLNLNSPFLFSTLIAFLITFFLFYSIWGLSRWKNSFYYILIFFPFTLFVLSLIFSQYVIQTGVYLFYGLGFLAALQKTYIYNFSKKWEEIKAYFISLKNLERTFFIFTIVYILVLFSRASVPGSLIDSMSYHLGAPKEWTMFTGAPKFNPNNPITMSASYFEYFYYSIFLMLKPVLFYLKSLPTTSFEFLHVVLLMTAQYICAFIGIILVPFLFFKLFVKSPLWGFLLVIFLLSLRDITWTWTSPKNAPIPVLYFLVTYKLLKENFRSFRLSAHWLFLAFFIMGIAFGTKLTNIYSVFPIAIFLILLNYETIQAKFKFKKINGILLILVAGFIGVFPYFLRNYIETGCPVFPGTSSLFPHDLTTQMFKIEYAKFSAHSSWELVAEKISTIIHGNLSLVIIAMISLFFRTRIFTIFLIALIVALSKLTGNVAEFRYFPGYLILCAFAASSLENEWQKSTLKIKFLKSITIVLILTFSHFQIERPFKYFNRYYRKPTIKVLENQMCGPNLHYTFESNLKNINKKYFVTNSHEGHYYSRFPFIEYEASKPELRRPYYQNQIEKGPFQGDY